jgi:hypothetical protein
MPQSYTLNGRFLLLEILMAAGIKETVPDVPEYDPVPILQNLILPLPLPTYRKRRLNIHPPSPVHPSCDFGSSCVTATSSS